MSLNDGLLDDIKDKTIDDDLIKSPNNTPVIKDKIEIIPSTSTIKSDEENTLSEDQLNKLPLMNVEFKVITDNATKIVDLKDVEADILGLESISKYDVKNLNEKIPSFFNKGMSLEHFTQQRTLTGYSHTLKVIKTTIAKEELELYTSIQKFINEPLNDAKILLTAIREKNLDFINSNVDSLNSECVGFLEALSSNPNLVFPIDSEFVNLGTTNLAAIDFNKVSQNVTVDGSTLNKAVSNINKVMESKYFKAFFFGVIEDQDLNYITSVNAVAEHDGKSVTVVDLVKFYDNNVINKYLSLLDEKCNDLIKQIESISEEGNKLSEAISLGNKFIVDNQEVILDMIKAVQTNITILYNLNMLNFNSAVIIQFYKKL